MLSKRRMLINATQVEEIRVAIVDDHKLFDLDIQSSHRLQKKANIYKARISRIEPSLNAVFVDYGADRHGFLPIKEIAQEYLSKPIESNADIRSALKEGQEIIIQIDKEERGNKGAAITTYITLAGCYLVLMPNNQKAGGVSRRIEGDDRQQLKTAMSNLVLPDSMGVIARTAGLGRTAEELQWDLDALLKLWDTVNLEAEKQAAPFLIYQESDVILRSVRDYLRQDIDEIIVDDKETYNRVMEYVKRLRPDFLDRMKFYDKEISLFSHYAIESQIETAYQREITLPLGGSIVIDYTEALTSIDINSARATKGGDIEETALQTNLEAAVEIARQLKLRDLGGLIVIDFIDMSSARNQRDVENKLTEAVKQDRARIQIGKISRFGLLEMSRQRIRPSLDESSSYVCPRCTGQGTIRGVESLSLSITRLIKEEALRPDTLEIQIQLPISVATFLLNEKRHLMASLETQYKIRIILLPNPSLETPHYVITRHTKLGESSVTSYLLTKPIQEQEHAATSKHVTPEKPAIRTIDIIAAPHTKNTLLSSISKLIQGLFGAGKTAKVAANTPVRPSNQNNRNRNNNNRNGQNRPRPAPTNRPERKDEVDASTGAIVNKNPNARRKPAIKTEGAPEARRPDAAPRTNTNPRQGNRGPRPQGNRPARSNEPKISGQVIEHAAAPSHTPSPAPVVQASVVQAPVVHAPVVETPVVHKPVKAGPTVQEVLARSSLLSDNSAKQTETVATNQTPAPKKLNREEVVSQTTFTAEQAKAIMAKNSSATAQRVETAQSSNYVQQTHNLSAVVAVVDKK
ncbi:MAG: Rne/Rng family ribonuclease [Gammaproteobacteria bacterium]|nr:Rne/Rng family ribonuclease [Gammaproteobacteria bacterium]